MSATDTATALAASHCAGLSRDNRKHLIAAIAVAIEDAVAEERERCAAVCDGAMVKSLANAIRKGAE